MKMINIDTWRSVGVFMLSESSVKHLLIFLIKSIGKFKYIANNNKIISKEGY